jgi:hypothetical protein
MMGDKIFLVMSNLYFFNLSTRIHMDFIAAFHLVSFFDFKDVFLIRAAVDQ